MGANGQGPPGPQLASLAQAQCISCKGDFMVRIPPPRIINGPDFTNIVFVHPQLDKCPNCGTQYVFRVHHIDQNGTLGFDWVPIKAEQSVVPGTQSNLNQALQNDDIAKKIKLQ
jgi:hypothetical protein